VQFAILGPVEARMDGSALQLGGPKPRALLAMLLLDANEPVSRDRLIEGLWGDDPPPSADQTLDSYVSRLRRVLGPDRVVRRPPGYLLVVEPGELDLERFERLVEDRSLHEALRLWRGPALADVLYEPFACEEAERLEERRLVALEDRIEVDLAGGEGAQLVPELEVLTQAHPFRERLTAQLMLALYRAGRQADALAAMRAARERLDDELGLAPGPRLRELEQQILDHDPRLDPSRPAAAAPPARARRRPLALAALALAAVAGATALLVAGGDSQGASASARVDRAVAIDPGTGHQTAAAELPGTATAAVAAAGSLWLADPEDQLVLRLDPDNGQIEDRITMPGQPGSLTAAGGAVWVAGPLSGSVTRIDPASGRVTQTVRVGSGNLAAIASLGSEVVVADSASRALVILDARTGAIKRRHTLALRPTALAVAAGDVWVASYDDGVVAHIDPATGRTLRTVRVGGGPSALTVAGGVLWTANALDATVSRVDPLTGTLTGTVAVGSGPAAFAADGHGLWVVSQYAGALARIDTGTIRVTRTVRVAGQPGAVAVAGGRVWVAAGPSPTAHRGGTLRMVTSQPLNTIDPGLHFTVSPLQLAHLTHDSLVSFQVSAGPAGLRLVPDLAVALPRPRRGGREYTFRLRRGIVYSDGRPLRATDFRRGIERLFRIHSAGAGYFEGIAHIAADDRAGTVTFRLRAPDPDFLFKLTVFGYAAPIPPGVPDRDAGATAVGTGPYKVASFAPHRGVRLVRNPRFREWSHAAQPAGNPDVIELRVVDGYDAAARAVERGDADWLFGAIPPARVASLRLEHPAQVHENRAFGFDFIPLNTHVPPFDDVRVRRALNFAIDRGKVARMYGPGVATPRCQALVPGLLGHRPYCPYPHDLAKARALVAASGTRGRRVEVRGLTDEAFLPRALPAYVASVLRSLGYRVSLHRTPNRELTPALRRRIQLSTDGDWLLDYPAPSAYLPQFFGCHGGLTNGYVCDRELDRLMARAIALQLRDPRRAAAAWAAADRRITDQALWVSTVTLDSPELVSKRLGNYQFHPVWDFIADQAWVR
jgi:ABC-type transport system substrate-binding protein/DNA-binding SARP family transcriptional activator/streptogramin lyase